MPSAASILSLATAVTGASAAFQGFNYDNKGKSQQTFEAEFKNAQNLEGTNGGFTSARLYTMIQDGTTDDPISAIPAAISTKTSLLFGLWASSPQDIFDHEISALKKTIDQYCGQLDGLVAGISVGSEDLYRDSPVGRAYGENPGVGPDVLSKYVDQTRKAIKGSCLEKIPVGHVDTWTAYANETNRDFSSKLDFVGMDAYPYYENQKDNSIENAEKLLEAAIANTNAGTGNKPLWITETGWPVSGKSENKAESGLENAKKFWRAVGCPRFGKVNVWWYTQQDGGPSTGEAPRFGVVGAELSTKPLFDLSCDGYENGSGSSSSSTSASSTPAPTDATTSDAATSTGSEATTTATSETEATTTGVATGTEQTSGTQAPTTLSTSSAVPTTSVPAGGSETGPVVTAPTGGSSTQGNGGNPTTSVSTVPPQSGASGLNSIAAAVGAIMMAVAAF